MQSHNFDYFVELKNKQITNKKSEYDFILDRKRKYFSRISNKIEIDINNISNIYTESDICKSENEQNPIQRHLNTLIPYSFAMWSEFSLIAPYFSQDDDRFYRPENHVVKEHVFKAPMIRPTAWKGALLKAALAKISEEIEAEKVNIENIFSFFRIFGTGDAEFRELVDMLNKKETKLDSFQGKFFTYLLLEKGINFYSEKGKPLQQKFNETLEEFKNKLKCKKGRAIFYPTYFNQTAQEVINPHDRKTKAGTKPIFYEVVPKDTRGIFQLIYIPFDGMLDTNDELQKQAKADAEFLKTVFETALTQTGIGAKTKLGWGLGEIKKEDKSYLVLEKSFSDEHKAELKKENKWEVV